MDKRNQAITTQNEKLMKVINDFGIQYNDNQLDEQLDNQELFKLLSDENKKLKLYTNKINKINELNAIIQKKSIDNDISIELPKLTIVNVEELDRYIGELNNTTIKINELILHNLELTKEDDIVEEPPKIDLPTITNMEEIKRAFFNNEYDVFQDLIKDHNFGYFNVEYKYSSENDNKPEYIAKNLVGGFVRNIEDFAKYFLVCFRCYKIKNTYIYHSLWMVNIKTDNYLESIKEVIGTVYDDFTFTSVDDVESFLNDLQKKEITDELIIEKYVH